MCVKMQFFRIRRFEGLAESDTMPRDIINGSRSYLPCDVHIAENSLHKAVFIKDRELCT